MLTDYRNLLDLIEQLHRQLHELIKAELERNGISELNPVQALFLLDIGAGEVSVDELKQSGRYKDSSVFRSLNNLEKLGYVTRRRKEGDQRVTLISLTLKGVAIRNLLQAMLEGHMVLMNAYEILDGAQVDHLNFLLRQVRQLWKQFPSKQ